MDALSRISKKAFVDLQEETELEIVEVLHRNMGGQRRNKTHRCRSSNKKGMKKEEASVQGLTKQEHTKTTVPTMVAKVRSWDLLPPPPSGSCPIGNASCAAPV